MFLLTKTPFADDLYRMGRSDVATNGSATSLITNICESANTLDPFENVFSRVHETFVKMNRSTSEVTLESAENVLKPLYQRIRHGLAFDWVMNYVLIRILEVYPFIRAFEFPGTRPFLESFKDDEVFTTELKQLDILIDSLLDFVFEGYPDRTVYSKIYKLTGVKDLFISLNSLSRKSIEPPLLLPSKNLARTDYLVLLSEMLTTSIGVFKRGYWTDTIDQIYRNDPSTEGCVVVTGGRYRVFAFGNLTGTPKWHLLDNGISRLGLTERTSAKDYPRAFPDEMTFFKFSLGTGDLYIDETRFPVVSLNNGPWITILNFLNNGIRIELDTPYILTIKYNFVPKKKKIIKVKSKVNTVIKDREVELNSEGIVQTQIVFRSNNVSFMISDVDKEYPFAMFSTSKISSTGAFAWLE